MPASAPEHAIETENLRKVYAAHRHGQEKEALKGIDLQVPRGSFFALLGPNGAGKSSLINILAGLALKTSGKARIWGHDIDTQERAARLSIGIVPQELNLDPFFTPRELLEVQAGLYGVPKSERRSDEILAAVGLTKEADAYARSLSGGMQRRLLVAKAMVHSPPILILDEPTAGVDVELRRQLWASMQDLNARGTTVLLTTHYLEEAEELCDTIAIINQGELVTCETKANLLSRLDTKEMIITVDRDIDAVPAELSTFRAELKSPQQVVIRYAPSEVESGQVIAAVQKAGLGIIDLATREAELEDIFLRLTRRTPERAA